jgi:hypothetical protein
MARRYGGDFSPDSKAAPRGPEAERPLAPARMARAPAAPDWGAKRVGRAGARTNLLFFVPIPFAINAFRGDSLDLALGLSAFGLLILAAWLTREGVIAQDAYDARKVAKRPAIPRKMFGAVLTGLGALAAGGLLLGRARLDAAAAPGVVLPELARVRVGPGAQYKAALAVVGGVKVQLQGRDGDFVQVRLPDGSDGWLPEAEEEALLTAYRLLWRLQAGGRLLSEQALDPEALGEGACAFLLREVGMTDRGALAARLGAVTEAAAQVIGVRLGPGPKGEPDAADG